MSNKPNILYHLTVLPPKMPQAEALSQEISALQTAFGGQLIYVNPNLHSPIHIPRLFFGLHQVKTLRTREQRLDLHHFYNPDPYPFPLLALLKRPVVYTITSGVERKPRSLPFFRRLKAITVPDERSLARLQDWGLSNVHLSPPGIDTGRFTYQPYPLTQPFTLMMASAPWTAAQFESKGVTALLAAAQQNPNLHLVFLWRGVLYNEMWQRVAALSLEKQVAVINQQVDVNQMLARVHASIVLADSPGIIKAYPHSLLDSLAAGKPVLVSQSIGMADYVAENTCGVGVEAVTASAILAAVAQLQEQYAHYQQQAQFCGQRDFSQDRMIAGYREIYAGVLES